MHDVGHCVMCRYRDIAVNLRIDSQDTRRLGVETHVCELQLILRSFADIKVFFFIHVLPYGLSSKQLYSCDSLVH